MALKDFNWLLDNEPVARRKIGKTYYSIYSGDNVDVTDMSQWDVPDYEMPCIEVIIVDNNISFDYGGTSGLLAIFNTLPWVDRKAQDLAVKAYAEAYLDGLEKNENI